MAWTLKPKEINAVSNLVKREYGVGKGGRSVQSTMHMIRGRYEIATSLYRKDLYSHFGCVNAIEFSNDGQWLMSGTLITRDDGRAKSRGA